MSLFEWLGESYNPGPVGTVDMGGRGRPGRSRAGVLVCFALAAGVLGLWVYLVVGVWQVWNAAGLTAIGFGTLLYLFLGYTVHPKPDTSNIGWAGGLFDHPFRYSDDINRTLIFLTVALWPGRFVSESLVDMGRLVAHAMRKGPKGGEVERPESRT